MLPDDTLEVGQLRCHLVDPDSQVLQVCVALASVLEYTGEGLLVLLLAGLLPYLEVMDRSLCRLFC